MIVVPTEAYPLTWPQGAKRTKYPSQSAFGAHGIAESVNRIRSQLRLLGSVKTIIISSNMPQRGDGFPYSVSSVNPDGDAGVAVYWTRSEKRGNQWVLVPYCMPCDKWRKVHDNLYAVSLSIQAMRGMDRWGAVSMEQAFAGFAALPAGSGDEIIPPQPKIEIDWRAILGGTWPDLDNAELYAIAKARHRKAMETAHPDVGGSDERATELNVAIAAAEQELLT